VIELEEKVVAANRTLAGMRSADPLQDPRVTVYINDARSALALTDRRYDYVVSQPSHPWTAGASHLYTREYMELVERHLRDDGVYLQWMNSGFVTAEMLGSLCATILAVFNHVNVYQWERGELFFVASNAPLRGEIEMARSGRPLTDAPGFYRGVGVSSAEDMVASLLLDDQGVTALGQGRPLITDDHNLIAAMSVMALERGLSLDAVALARVVGPHVPSLDEHSWVHRQLRDRLNFAAVASGYRRSGLDGFALPLIEALERAENPQALLLSGLILTARGATAEGRQRLIAASIAMPDNEQVRYALVRPWLGSLGGVGVPDLIQRVAGELRGVPAHVLSARTAAMLQDWRQVATHDQALAAAVPGDLWFGEAVKLRVDWRNNLRGGEARSTLADQALRILDLAISVDPDPDFFAMRVASAYAASRPEIFVQSTRALLRVIDVELKAAEAGQAKPGIAELQIKLRRLRAVRAAAVEVVRHYGVDRAIGEELARGLDARLERVSSLIAQGG
jgi:hypothetical protein